MGKGRLGDRMDKKRTIFISASLLLFTLFILLYRVGSLSRKLDDYDVSIKNMEKSLTQAIANSNKDSNQVDGAKEGLTAELMYNFTSFNKETGQAKAEFNLVPKEIYQGLEVNLVSSGDVINLKRDSVIFQGSHKYKLNDKFLSLVTYRDGDKVEVEKLDEKKYNLRVGDLLIPKIGIEKKSLEKDSAPNKYNVDAVMKFSLTDSLVKLSNNSAERSVGFQSLEVKLDINEINVNTMEIDITEPGFSEEYKDIKFSKDIAEGDKVELYIEAMDEHGLMHKSYIDVLNEEEFINKNVFKVTNPDNKAEIFEY